MGSVQLGTPTVPTTLDINNGTTPSSPGQKTTPVVDTRPSSSQAFTPSPNSHVATMRNQWLPLTDEEAARPDFRAQLRETKPVSPSEKQKEAFKKCLTPETQKLVGENGLEGATCPAQMRNALRVIEKYNFQFEKISVEAQDLEGNKVDIPKDVAGRVQLNERFKRGEIKFTSANPLHKKALEELYKNGFAVDEVVPVPNEKATIALNPEKILSGEYYVLALTGMKPGTTERQLLGFTQGGIHCAGHLREFNGMKLEDPKIKLFENYSEYAIVEEKFQRDGVQDAIHVVTAGIGREMARRENGIFVKKWGEQELRGQVGIFTKNLAKVGKKFITLKTRVTKKPTMIKTWEEVSNQKIVGKLLGKALKAVVLEAADISTEKRADTYTNKGWEVTQGENGQHLHIQPQVNPEGATVPLNPVERTYPLTQNDKAILERLLPPEVKTGIDIQKLDTLPSDCWTKQNEIEKRNRFDEHFSLLGRGITADSREIQEPRAYFDAQMKSIDHLVRRPVNEMPDLIDQARTNPVLAKYLKSLYGISGIATSQTPEGRQIICDVARSMYEVGKELAGWERKAPPVSDQGNRSGLSEELNKEISGTALRTAQRTASPTKSE